MMVDERPILLLNFYVGLYIPPMDDYSEYRQYFVTSDDALPVDINVYSSDGYRYATFKKGSTGGQIAGLYYHQISNVYVEADGYKIKFKPRNLIYTDGTYVYSQYPVEKKLQITTHIIYGDGSVYTDANVVSIQSGATQSSNQMHYVSEATGAISKLSYYSFSGSKYCYSISN